jgi:hypothetical protein
MKLFSSTFIKGGVILGAVAFAVGMSFLFSPTSIVFSNTPEIESQEVFKNYKTEWASSSRGRIDDPYRKLLQLTSIVWNANRSSGSGATFVDVNGDGLADLLYMQHGTYYRNGTNFGWEQRMAVLMNTGVGYEVQYTCVIHNEDLEQYFGDCAIQ